MAVGSVGEGSEVVNRGLSEGGDEKPDLQLGVNWGGKSW